jgi:hypothetical protein
MDKQFARILMLSVLLPAGAAVAEAIQHEYSSFDAIDRNAMSKLAETLPADKVRQPLSEDKSLVGTTSAKHDKQFRVVARSDAHVRDDDNR